MVQINNTYTPTSTPTPTPNTQRKITVERVSMIPSFFKTTLSILPTLPVLCEEKFKLPLFLKISKTQLPLYKGRGWGIQLCVSFFKLKK